MKGTEEFKRTKVVPMFHGTGKDAIKSICRTNLASFSQTDIGYYGKGVYHTSSAKYAQIYAKNPGEGVLLMNWVCFSSVYPVIHHPKVDENVTDPRDSRWLKLSDKKKKKHWVHLTGKAGAIAPNYNAHYVLVSSTAQNKLADFYPFVYGGEHQYDELVTFDASQVLPRYLVTLASRKIHKPLRNFTPHDFQEAVRHVSDLPKLIEILSQKTFQAALTSEDLVELGHIRCLTEIKNLKVRQESVLLLETKRAVGEILRQHSHYRSTISVDELFKPCTATRLDDAGKDPFENIRLHISGNPRNYAAAINSLSFLFRTNADVNLCYSYLFELFLHIQALDTIALDLPYLIGRSPDKPKKHRKLATKLAEWFTDRTCDSEAIGCYAKALRIKESIDVYKKSSKLFLNIVGRRIIEAEVKLENIFQWTSYLEFLESLNRFFLEGVDRDIFYQSAKVEIRECKLPEDEHYYALSQRIATPPLFIPPTKSTTQRYWEAYKTFTAHFTNGIKGAGVKDVRELQEKALKSFTDFFEILVKDAFGLLGYPTSYDICYDIRMGGSMGLGEIFPYSNLECVILMSGQDRNLIDSLVKILEVQFLTIDKKVTIRQVVATEIADYSVLKSISLVTSSPNFFIKYQEECWKQPFDLPKFNVDAFQKEWKEKDVSLSYIQEHYRKPLVQFLSDLILYHKIEHKNLLDGIDALKDVFTENSRVLLKESVGFLYHLFLSYNEETLVSSLQEKEIAVLQKCHWLVLSPLYSEITALQKCHWLVLSPLNSILYTGQEPLNLDTIAQTKGFNLLYEEAQFRKDMKEIFVPGPTKVKITRCDSDALHSCHLHSDYLCSDLADEILDKEGGEGGLVNHYVGSAHQVCSIGGFHLKQRPSYPLIEYAVHNLCSRIAGDFTPCVELVRFDIGDTFYPVLISRTISGNKLKKGDPLDLKQWTRMLLCAILTRPADGQFWNYIIKDQKIYCVDNDLSFVEPAEVSWSNLGRWSSSEVHFFTILFCMQSLDTNLDQAALDEFKDLDRASILDGWIEDVIQKEKEYTALFSEAERDILSKEDSKGKTFTTSIPFKKGALATLDLQFWRLQALIGRSEKLKSGDLLKELINIHQESVGAYVYKAYDNAKNCPLDKVKAKITSSTEVGSLTNVEYQKAVLGKKIEKHDDFKNETHPPESARKEFVASLLKKFDHAAIITRLGETTIQANFQAFADDLSLQTTLLKALVMEPLKKAPQVLILNYNLALNATLLIPFLHSGLEYIDLSYCPKIDDVALSKIHSLCPNLKHLCLMATGITQIKGWGWGEWGFLEFPKLEYFNISSCVQLNTLQFKASNLKTFIMNDLPLLDPYKVLEHAHKDLKKNKNFVLMVVAQWGYALQYAHEELKKDEDIVLAATKQNGRAFEYAHEDLKQNENFVLAAVKQNDYALQYAHKDLKKNENFVLAAVKQNGLALQYVYEGLKKNKDIALAAVKQNGRALTYTHPDFKKNKENILAAVKLNGDVFQYASEDFQKDREVVLAAIAQNSYALKNAHENLLKDKVVVLAAAKKNGWALEYAHEDLKKDEEFILAAIKQNSWSLKYANENLKKDKAFVLAAIKQNSLSLKYAHEELKKNEEFVLAAVKQNGGAFKYVHEDFKKDMTFVLAAVRQNGMALRYAHENFKEDKVVVLAAVVQNGWALRFAHENFRKDYNFILAAITQKGCTLRYFYEDLRKDENFIVNVQEFCKRNNCI